MDIDSIPQPEVLESLDYERLFKARKARLLELAQDDYQASGEVEKLDLLAQSLALESEPMVKLLQESVYRELLLRQRVNDAARAVMLPLATGGDLDNLGALYGVARAKLPDNSPEGDGPYRQRLLLAPKSLSTAGSKAAYKFHALSAGNQADKITVSTVTDSELQVTYRYNSEKNLVKDATVGSSAPCQVQVYVLGFDGYGHIDASGIEKISAHLGNDRIRPLGDRVEVFTADIVLYRWRLVLHLASELEGAAEIELVLKHVKARLAQFVEQHHFLGKAIRHSTLLGTIAPAINGWVELTLFQGEHALGEDQVLLVSQAQAPHLDLSQTQASFDWHARLGQAIEQSIEVTFDG